MKQRVKRNNRKKADFGASAIIGSVIAALASVAGAGINAANNKRIAEENQRQQLMGQNAENAIMAQTNQQQALNYDKNNEIATMKTGALNTINSNFKCGGKRRMKKSGGCITSSISKLGLYI